MKRIFIPLAIALQLGALAFMVFKREHIIRKGDRIQLQTVPVDPRDIFRGDYVRLGYEITELPKELWEASVPPEEIRENGVVYVSLEKGDQTTHYATRVGDERPADTPFIRGRLDRVSSDELRIRYGIEAYFMEQGTALDLENRQRRDDQGFRKPLNMRVALGNDGTPVLLDHQWSPLAIGLNVVETFKETERPKVIEIAFRNDSDGEIGLPILPGGHSFSLRPEDHWRPADASPAPKLEEKDIVRLMPGGTHAVTIDLLDPRWHVSEPDSERPPGPIPDNADRWRRWRFRYSPHAAENPLPSSDTIWREPLSTPAFSNRGRVD